MYRDSIETNSICLNSSNLLSKEYAGASTTTLDLNPITFINLAYFQKGSNISMFRVANTKL